MKNTCEGKEVWKLATENILTYFYVFIFLNQWPSREPCEMAWVTITSIQVTITAWKITKYGVFLVRIFLYSYWIQENTDQKKLHIWTLFTHWNLAPIVLFFCYMQTLCYFMSLAPLKIDVFPVHKLRTRFAWKIFFQFWKTKKGGFFNSITAPILSKTGSLNLRKSCPLINSYLLHMMIFVERRTLHE